MRILLLAAFLGLLLTLTLEPAASQRFECHSCVGPTDCETSTRTTPCFLLKTCSKTTFNGETTGKGCGTGLGNLNCGEKAGFSRCVCQTSLCNAGRRSIGTGMGGALIFSGLGVLLAQRLWQ